MKNKTIFKFLVIIILTILLAIIVKFAISPNVFTSKSNGSSDEEIDVIETSAELSLSTVSTKEYSNYDTTINLNDLSYKGNGVSITDTTITISEEGVYYFTGTLNDGNIVVEASDDGINVSGGSEEENMMGMMQTTTEDSNRQLVINNGTIYVDAEGDGLDANGSIIINGGNITVAGTTRGGDAALDYDATCRVNGGTLIFYGATDMWQNPSTTSNQYSICFGTSGNPGDTIILKDSNGDEIASVTTDKSYGAITISTPNLKKGESYTLYINGNAIATQQITNIVTSNLTTSNGMGINEQINERNFKH